MSNKKAKEEMDLILKIVDRGYPKMQECYNARIDMVLDLYKTHESCPLKLKELLEADDFNFFHDVTGICEHINRETGELEDCFLPRFAK